MLLPPGPGLLSLQSESPASLSGFLQAGLCCSGFRPGSCPWGLPGTRWRKGHPGLTVSRPSHRFAKLLLRLPALRSIGLKCLEHLFFFKLIGDTPIDTFLMEMLEAPHQMT